MTPPSPAPAKKSKVNYAKASAQLKKRCVSYILPPSRTKSEGMHRAGVASEEMPLRNARSASAVAQTPETDKPKRFVVHYSPARMLDFDSTAELPVKDMPSPSEDKERISSSPENVRSDTQAGPKWEMAYLSNGKAYWYNISTGESSWSKPHASKAVSHPRSSTYVWKEYRDKNSCPYYYNPCTNEVTWTKPFKSLKRDREVEAILKELDTVVNTIEDLDKYISGLILRQPKDFKHSLKALEKMRARSRLKAISGPRETRELTNTSPPNFVTKRVQALPQLP